MKNLETMGVQEMNAEEMKEENGGIWQYVVAYILIEALINPSAHIQAFKDGYNSI